MGPNKVGLSLGMSGHCGWMDGWMDGWIEVGCFVSAESWVHAFAYGEGGCILCEYVLLCVASYF